MFLRQINILCNYSRPKPYAHTKPRSTRRKTQHETGFLGMKAFLRAFVALCETDLSSYNFRFIRNKVESNFELLSRAKPQSAQRETMIEV